MKNIKISVVVPVYGCPNALRELHSRITKTISRITKFYEIILVDDGCPKNSWYEIEKICIKDKKVTGIKLSRNFGQHHATNAGIEYSSGEYVILMDCDLQDRPEGIEKLYQEIVKGYDVVFSKRKNRKDNRLTLWLSKMFYKIYNYFTNSKYDHEIGNYCIATRKVVNEYLKIDDKNKIFINYLTWMGFNTSTIEIDSDERYDGKSSYTLGKKIDLAIEEITSQSNKPLKMLIRIGLIIAFVGFAYLLVQLVKYFVTKDINEGWTSIVALILLLDGIIIICLGGVGIYVGNVFTQTKGVPEYIVDKVINNHD